MQNGTSNHAHARITTVDGNHKALKALWQLSGFQSAIDTKELSQIICDAPDPETACQVITKRVNVESDALHRKWRKVISETWHEGHPGISVLEIPLKSEDVMHESTVRDALGLLAELSRKPGRLEEAHREWVIHPHELHRFLTSMPSLKYSLVLPVSENEWSYLILRRMRALLQALRLIRIYRGKLVVNRGRYERFLSLPLPQQYYVLWHGDVYHVDWSAFAGRWAPYVHLMQDSLPLIWEVSSDLVHSRIDRAHDIVRAYMDLFEPLWQEDRGKERKGKTFMSMYERCALPAIIEKLLVSDIFVRHGLIEVVDAIRIFLGRSSGQAMLDNDVTRWTSIAHPLIVAEQSQKLPCVVDLLD